ncbi:MAG: hypothetical protein ACO2Z1_03440 [Pontimonas sp.]
MRRGDEMPARESRHIAPSARTQWVRRAAFSGLLGVSTGLVAHLAMGGDLPGLMGVLPALVASILLSLVVLVKKTFLGTIVATISGQYVFHQWSGLGGAAATGHVHGEIQPLVATLGTDASMTLGHALAAAVTALFVMGSHRVRRSLQRVAELVVRLVLRAIPGTPRFFSPTARSFHAASATAPLWQAPLAGAQSLRGPPLFA